MTKQEAIEFALIQIPNILPLEKDQIKELCEQTIKQANNDPEKIATAFMDILGQDSISISFIFEFNEKFLHKDKHSHANHKVAKNAQPSASPKYPAQSGATPIKSIPTLGNSSLPSHLKASVAESREKDGYNLKLNSLQEIDEVLSMLEVNSQKKNEDQYICNCQANRHPLFEPAPNCLECGKIICIKEGLHMNNCSFCGNELIPLAEKQRIIQLLHLERRNFEQKKLDENKPKERKKKAYKLSSGGGINLWKEQDKLFEKVEMDREKEREEKRQQILSGDINGENDELEEARERLEKLLHFQDTSAERTKIIDNASDFSTGDQNLWGSAYERALQLKKQQRNLRKLEKLERERNGRRQKVVLDLTIGKDGKVVMTEAIKKSNSSFNAASDDEIDEISDSEDLQDLEDIRNLKAEIEQQRAANTSTLTKNRWDYQKFQSQFEKPKYLNDATPSATTATFQPSEKCTEITHRVQMDSGDGKSLQDEIIAML